MFTQIKAIYCDGKLNFLVSLNNLSAITVFDKLINSLGCLAALILGSMQASTGIYRF